MERTSIHLKGIWFDVDYIVEDDRARIAHVWKFGEDFKEILDAKALLAIQEQLSWVAKNPPEVVHCSDNIFRHVWQDTIGDYLRQKGRI